ncbi:hypothetical protein FB45DRAFT_733577, partial [Roridomyces roridus]
THVITVANNLTATNASAVFTPNVLTASLGDTIVFNFTQGNHSFTRSAFDTPCIPLQQTNASSIPLSSGIRATANGTSSQYIVTMNPDIVNQTIWYYDEATCGIGGVGVINTGNVSATDQPYDAFVRNAERLNGTAASATSSSPASSNASPTSGGGNSGPSSGSNSGSNTSSGMRATVPTVLTLLGLAAALVF